MRKFITLLLVSIVSLTSFNAKSDNYPKQEFRAAWITTAWRIDWPTAVGTSTSVITEQKNEMTKYLDILKANGFNAVFFQVRSMCDAFYKSKYEPWSSYLTGSRGTNPGWDPLAFVVSECHKRNMECHAWVNPYRYSTGATWSTTNDNAMKNNGWLLTYDGKTILDPGNGSARWRIVNVCKDIVNNYDIDGLVFDDYFYPENIPENSSAGDYSLWQSSKSSLSFGDWRRSNVNKMVKNICDMIRDTKPWVRFGISPAGAACSDPAVAAKHGVEPLSNYCKAGDWQYNSIYSDPVQWLEEGTIDYISPQIYWFTNNSDNPFGPMTQWWSKVAKKFNRHHFASHSTYVLQKNNTEANYIEFGQQLQLSRDYTENDAPGSVFYSLREMSGKSASGLAQWLKANKYQYPATMPAMTWLSAYASDPGKISNFTKNGNTLTCDAKSNMRYVFYAIPLTTSRQSAKSDTGKGFKAEYIVEVSYTNATTLTNRQSGYWYAVAPIDRYGNEWDFTTLYEPIFEQAPKASLLLPVNGSVHKPKNIAFTFTNANVDSYKIVIAKDEQMQNVVCSQVITPTMASDGNYTYNFSAYGYADGVYYWKIVTAKEGNLDTDSEIRNFTIQAISESCKAAELISPQNGEVLTLGEVRFVFKPTDADSYKLIIGKDEKISTPLFESSNTPKTDENGNLYYAGDITKFNKNGVFYWKIQTSKAEYFDNYSSIGTFTISRPTFDVPQLMLPANGELTENDDITFVAADNEADSYILEISLYEDFNDILYTSENFTKENTKVYFHVKKEQLRSNRLHYWRVRAVKNGGYFDGISEIRRFTPEMPTTQVSEVYYPENGYEFDNTDVVISASNPAGITTKLEIATDENFDNIVYFTLDKTITDQLGAPQYIIPYSKFTTGKYFFRIVTSESGYNDGISEIRYFYVYSDIESVKTENTDYHFITSGHGGYYKLTNLWIRSNSFGNGDVSDNSQVNRDIAPFSINEDGKGTLLMTYNDQSTKTNVKFWRFDAATGKKLSDLGVNLSSAYSSSCTSWGQYLNSVMVDEGDNIFITNLAPGSKRTFTIGRYNPANGNETELHYWSDTPARLDHAFVYGNIDTDGYIFVPTSNSNVVYRLHFTYGTHRTTEEMKVNSLSTAPRMYIVDKDHFFVDGGGTYPEFYTWGNSTPSGVFNSSDELKPNVNTCNGVAYFTLGNDKFMVYPLAAPVEGTTFRIAKGDELPYSYNGLDEMWVFPNTPMGNLNPGGGDHGCVIKVAQKTKNTAYIYAMVPNNGVAAYKIEYLSVTGVDNIFDEDYKPILNNGELSFGCELDNLQIFNASGMLIANENNVSSYNLPETNGLYIIVIRKGDKAMTYKFVK